MAQEKDLTRIPKFFVRKTNVEDNELCEKCQHHRIVIAVKHGCDGIILTDVRTRTSLYAAQRAGQGNVLHVWCIHEDVVPPCLEHYKEVRAVR